jgi:cell fate (sporulation/competence/biofilm development) regulator YlbF (YheA/YmcA/DUF963 family)
MIELEDNKMVDLIEMARAIGKSLQEDERYLKFQIAQQNSDADMSLQELIGEFNLKRIAINNEAQKEDRDDEKLQQLNLQLRECYTKILENENMRAYNAAKEDMDKLVKRLTAIIVNSAEGEDPNTTDYVESCGGDCGSCNGCH